MKWCFVILFSSLALANQKIEKGIYYACGVKVNAELADTPASRQTGYMNKPEPKAAEGILFKFDSEQVQTFWMKNVPFDLDILFFDKKGKLVDSQTMKATSPIMKETVLPTYASKLPALYALEIKAGSLQKMRIKNCRLNPLP